MANSELFYSVAREALGSEASIAGLVIDLSVAVESYAEYMEAVDDNETADERSSCALLEREIREAIPHAARFCADLRGWLDTDSALHYPTHKFSHQAYADAIGAARELLVEQIRDPEGEANPEYTRGVVNLIADLFGVHEMDTGTRMDQVAEDIGLKVRYE